ncbi:FUSC family protein [Streptomyces sp. NPDC006739]|uniref:FUSC family protein n=1 Tax=Streptomyces sp. NPDC006739 TaxID=3364763 RepID=UPI003693818E
MSSATPLRLPLAGVLRLGRPSDIWFKPALSAVAAVAPPLLTLPALGRLDLAMYTMAGSLCALYGHHRPYATRARVLGRVVAGMVGGLAVALVSASLTGDAAVLVAVGALLAAVQKTVCDASRVGPPGNVVLTFVSSASLFVPQDLGQVPGHVALALAAGAWAWLIGMAPALVRPHGPERRATAQALNAAAAYATTHDIRTRATAAAAVHAARQALHATGQRPDPTRHALAHLLTHAETTLVLPAATPPERLRTWAHTVRGTGRAPRAAAGEVAGVEVLGGGSAAPRASLPYRTGPLVPLAVRTATGCALAGYVSLALGVGRPYWAVVTAASLFQANVTLTWSRGVQRVVGNLLGVLVFAAVVPLAHLHPALLVLLCLAFNFGAEALMGRNYWLGSVCVTPMALLVTEFARTQDPGRLITERVADTLVGALAGFLAAVAVTNRRAGDHLEHALTAAEQARERAARLLAERHPEPRALEAARRSLAAALVELRATADAASGEWWQRALPEERVVLTERSGHRTLAATVRRQELPPEVEPRTTEDVRP